MNKQDFTYAWQLYRAGDHTFMSDDDWDVINRVMVGGGCGLPLYTRLEYYKESKREAAKEKRL